MRRLIMIGLVVGLAALPLLPTPSQAAQTGQQTDRAAAAGPHSPWHCRALDNGQLCIRFINYKTGVDMSYDKFRGGAILASFEFWGPQSGTLYDDGPTWIAAGQSRSFAWNNVYPGGCIFGDLNVRGQGTIRVPDPASGYTYCG